MGNIFSVDLSPLITCCLNQASTRAKYVCNLKDNLKALETAIGDLEAQETDVMRRVSNEEGPGMKRTQGVENWRLKVEDAVSKAVDKIKMGPQEIEKLCFCGCFSRNYKSSYVFGKDIVETKNELLGLKIEGSKFESSAVVASASAEPIYIRQLTDNLQGLRTAKQELVALSDDVLRKVKAAEEQKEKRLAQVEWWLSSVEEIVSGVDELIRDGQHEIDNVRLQGCSSSSSSTIGERVAKRLEDITALKDKGDFKVVAERAPASSVIERNVDLTVGMETMLEKVWSCIVDVEKENGVIIGIWGMGGVGKTTLLAQINNKFLADQYGNAFDVVIWVTISKDFRAEKVQEDIWRKLGSSTEQWKTRRIEEKAEDIFNVLRKRKFVLLLDDLWDQIDLAVIGVPKGQKGSKIVLTSRSEQVCSRMDAQKRIKVEPLPWEKAWELFQEKLGEDVLSVHRDIPSSARQVAQECSGLPIALITIARAMSCKTTPQEWNYALEVLTRSALDSDFEDMGDEVFPRLKFSYDSLPSDKVRSCFLYCSLFPEDHHISKKDLADKWICEGLCATSNKGYDIIGTLVRACLLEEEGRAFVKMHDVIRDMALWIACKFEKPKDKFLVQAGTQLTEAPEMSKWEGVERISLISNDITELSQVPFCPNLSTLLISFNSQLVRIKAGFFQSMDTLTVLDMSGTSVKQLPSDLSRCASLQYLDVSYTSLEQLPLELKKLVKLKYLNLESTFVLSTVPRGLISGLQQLQVLKMYDCGMTIVAEVTNDLWFMENSLIEELQPLDHLNRLSITLRKASTLQAFLNSPKLSACAESLSLMQFNGSQYLNLSSLLDMKHLEKLTVRQFQDLQKMSIETPLCSNKSFYNLQVVIVSGCINLNDLSWLIILSPNLNYLRVEHCGKLEQVISVGKVDEEVRTAWEKFDPFGKLEYLTLIGMPQLKSVCDEVVQFAHLKNIWVDRCPNLKKLPFNSHSSKGNKVVILGEEEWWTNLEWDDDATKTLFLQGFQN